MTGKEYCEIVDGSRTIFTDVSCDSCHVSSDERICSPCIDSFEMFVIVKSEQEKLIITMKMSKI